MVIRAGGRARRLRMTASDDVVRGCHVKSRMRRDYGLGLGEALEVARWNRFLIPSATAWNTSAGLVAEIFQHGLPVRKRRDGGHPLSHVLL